MGDSSNPVHAVDTPEHPGKPLVAYFVPRFEVYILHFVPSDSLAKTLQPLPCKNMVTVSKHVDLAMRR
jgi:hypothetical protein